MITLLLFVKKKDLQLLLLVNESREKESNFTRYQTAIINCNMIISWNAKIQIRLQICFPHIMHSILITFWCFVTAYKVCCGLFSSSFFSPKWPTDLQNSTSFSDNLPVFIYVSTDLRVAFSCRMFLICLNLPKFIYAGYDSTFIYQLKMEYG